MRRRAKQLAKATFHYPKNYVNIECCGVKAGSKPVYMVFQHQWQLLKSHQWHYTEKCGSFNPGERFHVYHVVGNFLRPCDIQDMLDGKDKYYGTGGKHGKTLFMIDVDAHETWQDDAHETKKIISNILPHTFWTPTDRGEHGYCKLSYQSAEQVNQVLKNLQTALKQATASCKCAVEIKGTISRSHTHYGTLATLPCYKVWNENLLHELKALPEYTVQDLSDIVTTIPVAVIPKKKAKCGSCAGFLTAEDYDQIDQIKKVTKSVCYYLHTVALKPAGGRQPPKFAHFQAAMLVSYFMRKHPSKLENAKAAQNTVKAVWNKLREVDASIPYWHDSIWKAIRDTMVGYKVLNMIDNTYWFNPGEHTGKTMEWAMDDYYFNMIEKDGIYSDTDIPVKVVTPDFIFPELVSQLYTSWKRAKYWDEAEINAAVSVVKRPHYPFIPET
jgi:hypothetical protein